MNLLFTADLHINLRQKKVPKEWAINRYNILFEELDRVYEENSCEYEIHGGDIFDKLPNLEEMQIYLNYLHTREHKKFIIYDGNHEATKKGQTFFHILKPIIEGLSNAEVLTKPCQRIGCDFIPYTHIKHDISNYHNSPVLFTHVRGDIPPHVIAEIDLEQLNKWKTVFAGDLHSHSNCQRNIVYPGSPVAVTFHRNTIHTGVIVIDLDTEKWEWEQIEVPQLYRKTVSKEEDMVQTTFDHTIYEIEGDAIDLSNVKSDNKLLDKKLIRKTSEATLDLKNMTIKEELAQYLTKISNFSDEKLSNIMKVFDDKTTGISME